MAKAEAKRSHSQGGRRGSEGHVRTASSFPRALSIWGCCPDHLRSSLPFRPLRSPNQSAPRQRRSPLNPMGTEQQNLELSAEGRESQALLQWQLSNVLGRIPPPVDVKNTGFVGWRAPGRMATAWQCPIKGTGPTKFQGPAFALSLSLSLSVSVSHTHAIKFVLLYTYVFFSKHSVFHFLCIFKLHQPNEPPRSDPE